MQQQAKVEKDMFRSILFSCRIQVSAYAGEKVKC